MRTQIVALFLVIGIASTAYFALREDMPLTEIEPVARQGESIAAAAVNHEPELEVIQANAIKLSPPHRQRL